MVSEVILPRQGQSVETCLILEWKVRVGEKVRQGESLCEVETDKAVFDIEAPRDGTLLKVYHQEGEDVPVLSRLALLGEPGEDIAAWEQAALPESAAGPTRTATQPGPAAQPAPADAALPAPAPAPRVPGAGISPRARRLAARLGIDAAALAGSGPGGRVIERDIRRRAAETQPLTPAARARLSASGGTLTTPGRGGGLGGRVRAEDLRPQPDKARPETQMAAAAGPFTDLPLNPTRRRIAARLLESLHDSAQYTLHSSADAERLLSAGEELRQKGVTFNGLLLYIISRVLSEFPDLNSHFLGDRIRCFTRVHLGFAVDTDRGLLVPVIRDAGNLSFEQLSRESGRLAAACRENRVKPDELSGGTFTVSNLGGLGVESFTPLLNPPQVGILGLGKIGLVPMQGSEGVRFVRRLPLCLTVDHQAVDGAPAARFLQAVCGAIAAFTPTPMEKQKNEERV